MQTTITVTEKNAQDLIERPGNTHLVRYGRRVCVWSEAYYRMDPRGTVLMTRNDLRLIDPDADTYTPAFLAAMLSDYANHTES